MELHAKTLKQFPFNTRSKIEEHLLKVMDKNTHGEHLHQPLQTNIKQFKIATIFLTSHDESFNFTNKKIKFYFTSSISDEDGLIQITIPPEAYEIECFNNEIKRIFIDEEHYTQSKYPFTIKPNFSTLGFIIKISAQGPVITFVPEDSIRDLLGFNKTKIYEEYNLSPNPVDILTLDIFLEFDIAQRMIFKRKRSGIFHIFTMHVDLGYNYIEKFRGGVQWHMM